ncbi:Neuroligin 2 [Carabus blaptoides fortunei]
MAFCQLSKKQKLAPYIPTGFLKTGAKGSAQGNFGLMDLVAGLHWLRENLAAFGGDPDRITLMGHGTGAALANFIAVSPVAKEQPRFASSLIFTLVYLTIYHVSIIFIEPSISYLVNEYLKSKIIQDFRNKRPREHEDITLKLFDRMRYDVIPIQYIITRLLTALRKKYKNHVLVLQYEISRWRFLPLARHDNEYYSRHVKRRWMAD